MSSLQRLKCRRPFHVLQHLDESQVDGLMAEVFAGFRRVLDCYAKFDDYCRDNPQADD